jgi:hypothetical protein
VPPEWTDEPEPGRAGGLGHSDVGQQALNSTDQANYSSRAKMLFSAIAAAGLGLEKVERLIPGDADDCHKVRLTDAPRMLIADLGPFSAPANLKLSNGYRQSCERPISLGR